MKVLNYLRGGIDESISCPDKLTFYKYEPDDFECNSHIHKFGQTFP